MAAAAADPDMRIRIKSMDESTFQLDCRASTQVAEVKRRIVVRLCIWRAVAGCRCAKGAGAGVHGRSRH